MTERSYHQFCPIAHALDLVGDRWALLVVRDLVLGPKRFTDLRQGLPGIGTNVLTDRLKGLERAGVVRRRVLPPPAASAVYELTERGRDLNGVMVGLAHWGGQTLGSRRPDFSVSVESVLLALSEVFGRLAILGGRGMFAIRLDDALGPQALGVMIGEVGVQVDRDYQGVPDATVTLDSETLYALASGRQTLGNAVATGAVRLSGPPEGRERLLGSTGAAETLE